MRTINLQALALSFILNIPPAFASELLLGIYKFEPFFSQNNKGELSGKLLDDALFVLEAADIPIQVRMFPPARVLQGLETGSIPMTLINKRREMLESVHFSHNVFTTVTMSFATMKSQKITLNSLEDLKGKTVVLLRDYNYFNVRAFTEDEENHVEVYNLDSREQAFEMLIRNRADVVVTYHSAGKVTIQKMSLSNLVTISDIYSVAVSFALSKKVKNHIQIMEQIDEALLEFHAQSKGAD